MKNIFLTIQDTIEQLPCNDDQKESFWRFMVVLPQVDLEEISFVIKKKQEVLLTEFKEKHPLWLEDRLNVEEIQAGEPFVDFEHNKYRLAHTLYQILSGNDYTLASTWLRAAEIATKDTLRFSALTTDTSAQEYYNRVYTLLGWTYIFKSPNWFHDLFWSSFQLIQGFRVSFDIQNIFQNYILTFETIAIRHETILEIQALLEKNESILHTQDQKGGNSVKQWLNLLKNFSSTSAEKDTTKLVEAFCESVQNEYQNLNETNQYVLRSILSLYAKLIKGDYEVSVAPDDFLETLASLYKRSPTVDSVSLNSIKPLFQKWIKNCKNSQEAQKKFIFRFIDKVKIEDIVESIFTIDGWFKEIEPVNSLDLVYLDESENKFHWNEDIVAS